MRSQSSVAITIITPAISILAGCHIQPVLHDNLGIGIGELIVVDGTF